MEYVWLVLSAVCWLDVMLFHAAGVSPGIILEMAIPFTLLAIDTNLARVSGESEGPIRRLVLKLLFGNPN